MTAVVGARRRKTCDEGHAGARRQSADTASSSWMAKSVESSHSVADAIAALPNFESLKYPKKQRMWAERPGGTLPHCERETTSLATIAARASGAMRGGGRGRRSDRSKLRRELSARQERRR